jgi:hypothetical protein
MHNTTIRISLVATALFSITAPAIASDQLIDCTKMTRDANKFLLEEVARVGIKAVRGVGAQKQALETSIGVQQGRNFKRIYADKPVKINGDKMAVQFIDNFNTGFFLNDEGTGYNQWYIKSQMNFLAKTLKNNKKPSIYYGLQFSSNLSDDPDRRQCLGVVIFSIP